MPIIKSAKKRVRTAKKAAIRNSKTKRLLKSALKSFSAKPTAKSLSEAQSNIDRAAKKGVIHKNKAARLKSRAAQKAKKSGVKQTSKAKTAAKTTVKKSPAKKQPAKKS